MLAPAIMISACGLLLLGINNKYSLVVNRIRMLNQEQRSIRQKIVNNSFTTDDNIRLESIVKQIKLLMFRLILVRNTVLCYAVSIGLFVLTSLLLGIAYLSETNTLNMFIIALFLLGMISVLSGAVFTGAETYKGFEIVTYEVEAEQ
ncbi:MAG: DUF2721 domain-containing protein [Melioribacteraceae bacterium]|nr:DUF2721 domain-containing protein [Melioribacteraceae bacterium]